MTTTAVMKKNKENSRACFICGRPSLKKFCDLHEWRHAKTKANLCSVCGESFKQPSQLEFHRKMHGSCKSASNGEHSYSLAHLDWPFLCEMCGKIFLISKALINHQKMRHSHTSLPSKKEKRKANMSITANKTGHVHACCSCSKVFVQKDDLIGHFQEVHVAEKPWNCSVCFRAFSHQEVLERHMGSHNQERAFACTVCKKKFRLKHHLKEHLRIHTQEKRFHCDMCAKDFVHRNTFQTHLKKCIGTRSVTQDDQHSLSHLDRASHVTDKLLEELGTRSALIDMMHLGHREASRQEKCFVCETCNRRFTCKGTWKHHQITHTDRRPYVCDICGRTFKRRKTMTKHKRQYVKLSTFIEAEKLSDNAAELSDNAAELYNNTSELSDNVAEHSDSTADLSDYAAELSDNAGELFDNSAEFSDVATYSNETQVCQDDTARIASSIQRQGHDLVAPTSAKKSCKTKSGDASNKSFVHICCSCSKEFLQRDQLIQHFQDVHVVEKPWKCSACQKMFAQQEDLERHMAAHKKERAFACNFCMRKFRLKHHLKEHLRIHKQEKRFQCDLCNKTFVHRNTFQNHFKKCNTADTVSLDLQVPHQPDQVSHDERALSRKESAASPNIDENWFVHYEEVPLQKIDFVCETCNKRFTNRSYLKAHREIHSDERPYACDICSRSFKTRKSCIRHKSKTRRPNASVPAELSIEAANCNDDQEHRDGTASSTSGEPADLDNLPAPLQTKHLPAFDILGRAWFATEILNSTQMFPVTSKHVLSRNNVTTEQKAVEVSDVSKAEEKPAYPCDICAKLCTTESGLTIHRRCAHAKKRPYACLKCGRKFTLEYQVRRHLKSHTKEPVKCDTCQKTFSSKSVLSRHHNEVKCSHGGSEKDPKKLICDVCGRQYKYKSSLDQHQAVHSDVRPFRCEICKKSFKTTKQLKFHTLTHSEQRSFLCDLCGVAFKSRYGLQNHKKKVHFGVRTRKVPVEARTGKKLKPEVKAGISYACRICDRIFAWSSTYAHHMKEHTKKLLTCDTCGKSFAKEHLLADHERGHTQRKEFACHICGQAFWLANSLALHKEKGNCRRFFP